MAGPGIRAWELSKVLSRHFDVTLLVPDLGGEVPQADFQVYFYSLEQDEILREKEKENDFIIVQGFVLEKFPFLGETNKILIVDFYVPFIFENLFIHKLRERSLGNQM